DQVSLELGLAAVGFVTGGKLGAVGGPDRGLLAAALRETPVGKSAPAVRGGAGSFGPLRLPMWTGGPDPTLRVALRRSLPGQPVEVLALVSVEPFMGALADAQRFALGSIAVLVLLTALATAWMARRGPVVHRRADEDTIPPPRRTTPPPRAVHRPVEPVPEREPAQPEPAPAAPEPLPPPVFAPPAPAEPPPAPLSAAQLDELDAEPLPAQLPTRLPPPPPLQDLSALLDAMPPPPPPRTPPPAPAPIQRTPTSVIGGRFTPPRAAPPPSPLDYDHQPTTAYPIPDLPDFNAPPAAALGGGGPMANAIPDTTRVADIPPELLQASARPESTPLPRQRSPADEEHFQEVYREFVALRERCGESADGLTFEKFAVKLRKNRDQLMAKYSCRTVRFQVYVKDGKAALKATPVRT
ncbi:MAG TPA: MXAN_5187 family protein, partial [Anaeromyxobacter sp.]|nr:MXAN_5187 family protein [Anaeromyxobacter sp.]